MLSDLSPAQRLIYTTTAASRGQVFADRLLASWEGEKLRQRGTSVSNPVPQVEPASWSPADSLQEHTSYMAATELLEPYREALGAAYETVHALARCSVEQATDDDPAPHLMTTYWVLEEMTGRCERTLRRHLKEDGHSWSETVRHLIDSTSKRH